MENNFYTGTIFHKKKRFKNEYSEKAVLYKKDNTNYLDLIKDKIYTIDSSSSSYIIKDSLTKVNINDFKTDYLYLLNRHNNIRKRKKK